MLSTRAMLSGLLVAFFVFVSLGRAQTSSGTTQTQSHQRDQSMSGMSERHYEDVNKHGDMAMGFSHMKTTHHFGLTPSGGFIQVQANKPDDTTSRDQIREHLRHISKAFKDGDFSAPEMTHSRVPPGVPTMQRLKEDIDYKYAEIKTGGKVLISTKNPEALKAVHEFLRFQIKDHRTGDSTAVQ